MTGPTTAGEAERRHRAVKRMLDRLAKIGDTGWPQAGYVIGSGETNDHVTHDFAFCYEHACIVAHGDSIIVGAEMYIQNVSQSETDCQEFCAFHGCGEPINTGSPTDHWIDSALGLTEEDPYACHVTPYELARSSANMTADDKRWSVWMRQARRTLATGAPR